MKDNIFVDSNIVIYVFDNDLPKKSKAIELIKRSPFISPQVLIESMNICIRKLKLSKEQAFQNTFLLMQHCHYHPINISTFILAIDLSRKYQFSALDSIIIAAGLESGCKTLYSEDLQHQQKIENKLQIINPFI